MPCHPKAIARYAHDIRQDPSRTDEILDYMFDSLTRATEWDADQWGFNPDTWMIQERIEMQNRIDEWVRINGRPWCLGR